MVSDFFPNCSRNNRVSTSKNKGVDFLMQGNRIYMSGTWLHQPFPNLTFFNEIVTRADEKPPNSVNFQLSGATKTPS